MCRIGFVTVKICTKNPKMAHFIGFFGFFYALLREFTP